MEKNDPYTIPYKVLKGHKHKIQSAQFSLDGNYIISHCWDNTVKLWDVRTFSEIKTFSGHTDQVWCAEITPDNKHIVSGSMDRTIIIWDVESGEKQQQVQLSPYNAPIKGLIPELDREIPNSVYSVSIHPEGKHVAIASADKLVRIWDLEKASFLDTLDGEHITNWMNCRYSPDGNYLISKSGATKYEEGVVCIWETETYTRVARIMMSGSIIFTGRGELGISDGNGVMDYYNLSDGTLSDSKPFPEFKGNFNISPDGKYMVSCNEDSYIIIRNVKTQEVVWKYKNGKLEIHSARFSPDGKYLVAGRPEADIFIWEMRSIVKYTKK
ncbi:WD40 repeat domain-containing protein [Bacteroidota bacterium]